MILSKMLKKITVLISLVSLIANSMIPLVWTSAVYAQEVPVAAETTPAPVTESVPQTTPESTPPVSINNESAPTPAIDTQTVTPTQSEITSTGQPTPSLTQSPSPEPSSTPTNSPTPSTSEPTQTPTASSSESGTTPTPVSTEVIESLTPTPSANPSAQLTEPSPTAAPSQVTDSNVQAFERVDINNDYVYSKNDKVKVRFNQLPIDSGSLTIKEVKLSVEQIAQTGSLSDTAYEITSSMVDGTFTYDLTLPLPPAAQNQEVAVKAAETESELLSAGELNEPKEKTTVDTITIKGLNHFTVFIITTPSPDTAQRVLINEISPTSALEWVELFNNGTQPVNLASGTGWTIRNSAGNIQSLTALGTIPAAGRVVFEAPTGWLSDVAPETVSVLNELGSTIDTVTVSLTAPGFAVDHYPLTTESVGRRTDGTAEWIIFTTPTLGTANQVTLAVGGGLSEVSFINPANGYPTWYKDSVGVALQLCLGLASGLADPNCVLPAAGEEPNFNPANPVSFPTNFPGESFWYIADSDVAPAGVGGRARFRYALEGAFASAAPEAGQHIAFLRVNLQPISGLVPGATYSVIHPFGQFTMTADPEGSATAGTAPRHRDEDGAFAPPLTDLTAASFLSAPTTHISKFLKQVNPAPPAGYIGDGATLSTIEAGPNGNFVRITGPNIDVSNYDGDGNPNSLTINTWTVAGKKAGSGVPVITLFGANPVNANQGAVYTDAGATCLDDFDGNCTGNMTITGLPVDTATLGAKTVTYAFTDSVGSATSVVRTVNVVAVGGVDTTAPVITVTGANPVSVTQGTPYIDAGATALDNVDGDITASIVTTNPVNTTVLGAQTVTYNVSDAAGNPSSATRTVNVVADTVAPVITILGSNPVNILTGAPYTDAGATAIDNVGGDLTANIVTTGLPINTSVPGTFTVTYNVADASGNSALATRIVNLVGALTGGLSQAGPIDPANGFPAWYKDGRGLALQLCLAGIGGLADPNCVLPAAGEEPNFDPALAILFPLNFPSESFWYIADSDVAPAGQAGAGRVRFRYALEAAFASGDPQPNQQIAFLRVNLQPISNLVPGETYTVTHPFGQFTITADPVGSQTAGTAPSHRDEDGAFAPPLTDLTSGSFLAASTTHIGTFLNQVSPVPPAGYIGDGASLSIIESGPNGNFVRVVGPNIDVGNYDGDGNPNSLTINTWTISGKKADVTPPVITLNGANPLTVTPGTTYVEPGATCLDDFDGNCTASITVSSNVPAGNLNAGTGPFTVTYTATDRSGNTASVTRTVNVGAPAGQVLTSVAVTPAAPVINVGGTVQLSAAPLDQFGLPFVGSIITWSSADTNIAAVDPTGLVTGLLVGGPVTITATAISGATTVTGIASVTVNLGPVLPVLTSATVAPASATINVGATQQLTVSPLDQNGIVFVGAATTWSSSNTAVASVDASGLVTGVAAGGPVTITATTVSGATTVTDTSIITVAALAPATISGLVFQDTNANRVKDSGEPVLPGWTIYLDANNNRVFDAGETSKVSDAAGNYQFLGLLPGTYDINEVKQANWAIRLPGDNGYTQTVVAGDNITGKDFGNITTQTVGGQVQGGFSTTTGTNLTPVVVSPTDSVIEVSSNGGTSQVIVPADTTITESTGAVFDAAALAASDPAGELLTGLGTGVAVKGKLQWGVPNLGLVFSNPITLKIFVGTGLDGQTLSVLRSVDGTSNWTSDGIVAPGKCVVTAGICSFQATKASFYVAAEVPVTTTDNSSGNNSSSSGGSGGGSASAPVCNDAKPGSAPSNLRVVSAGNNEVTLGWDKATGPLTYYLLAYGLTSGQLQFGNPNVGDKETTSYTVKGLSSGVNYFFKVRAGNNCMPGDFSNEVAVRVAGAQLAISGQAGFQEGVLGTETEPDEQQAEQGQSETSGTVESNIIPEAQDVQGARTTLINSVSNWLLPVFLLVVAMVGLFFFIRKSAS